MKNKSDQINQILASWDPIGACKISPTLPYSEYKFHVDKILYLHKSGQSIADYLKRFYPSETSEELVAFEQMMASLNNLLKE